MAQALDRPLNAAALATFRRSLDGDVIATDDLEYDAARAVWNGIVDRRPALVARCTDAADVIKLCDSLGSRVS
jgi:FAD/FMN-containing dehydrogenase